MLEDPEQLGAEFQNIRKKPDAHKLTRLGLPLATNNQLILIVISGLPNRLSLSIKSSVSINSEVSSVILTLLPRPIFMCQWPN